MLVWATSFFIDPIFGLFVLVDVFLFMPSVLFCIIYIGVEYALQMKGIKMAQRRSMQSLSMRTSNIVLVNKRQ